MSAPGLRQKRQALPAFLCRMFAGCGPALAALAGGAAALGLFWWVRTGQGRVDGFIRTVSAPYKRTVSGWVDGLPFSVGESLCALGILALAVLAGLTIAQQLRGKKRLVRRLLALLALAVWIYAGVCALWGVHYYGASFQQKSSGLIPITMRICS